MDYIMQEIDRLVQILKSQEEIYTTKLQSSPPGGLIRILKRGHHIYMHAVPDGRDQNGKPRYSKETLAEDSSTLKQLTLKEYLRIALKVLDHNIRCLQQAKAGLLPLAFDEIRSQMRKPYQAVSETLLEMAFLEEGIRSWQHEWAAQPFEQSIYRPQDKIHFTSRGLAMRSRAEVLIAEMLYQYNIPFRYEQVIHAGKYELAPDFAFPGADGEEFYWEYCGMMADPTYRDHQLWRRNMYENLGITEWKNITYSYDAADGIDMREIEAVIKTKILPRIQGR